MEVIQCDLSSVADRKKETFEKLNLKYEVDLIVANAGIGGVNPGYEFSSELNNLFFEVNYFSVVDLIDTFVSQMKKRGSRGTCVLFLH